MVINGYVPTMPAFTGEYAALRSCSAPTHWTRARRKEGRVVWAAPCLFLRRRCSDTLTACSTWRRTISLSTTCRFLTWRCWPVSYISKTRRFSRSHICRSAVVLSPSAESFQRDFAQAFSPVRGCTQWNEPLAGGSGRRQPPACPQGGGTPLLCRLEPCCPERILDGQRYTKGSHDWIHLKSTNTWPDRRPCPPLRPRKFQIF